MHSSAGSASRRVTSRSTAGPGEGSDVFTQPYATARETLFSGVDPLLTTFATVIRNQWRHAPPYTLYNSDPQEGDAAMAHLMGDLASEPPSDPDTQAIITDFIDYTEYLPADVIRSLTLIRQLDEVYDKSVAEIHELTKTFVNLPSMPAESRPDAQAIRQRVSLLIDRAMNSRESSFAEAARVKDVMSRHQTRLHSITNKLESLPKPPSRDPTPAPTSPDIKRSKSGRRLDMPQKLTIKPPDASRHALMKQHRARNNRVTVPGEVLPPINPDSPLASTEMSDFESEAESPIPMPTSRVGATPKVTQKADKKKEPKTIKLKGPKPPREQRPPGMQGTNVHSQVAGISTTNALALLPKPPENPPLGSEYAPWTRLTEYEMAVLRKQMKKNAVWTPSKTMIRKTLFDRGRGWVNFWKAKQEAEANGEEFLDPEGIANWEPGRQLKAGEIGPDEKVGDEAQLSNRGMKLNQAKKRKKEKIAEENEKFLADLARDLQSGDSVRASAASTTLTMLRLQQSANNLKNLSFSAPLSQLVSQAQEDDKGKVKAKPKLTPKPKATPKLPQPSQPPQPPQPPQPSETSTPDAPATAEPSTKKRKRDVPKPAPVMTPATTTTTVPILPAGPTSASKASTPLTSPTDSKAGADTKPSKAAPALALRSSVAPKAETPTSTAPTTRPPSRRRSPAASAEPITAIPTTTTRDHLRRKSATPAIAAAEITTTTTTTPKSPKSAPAPATAASHRSKRPAPGPKVQGTEDGGTATTVSRRKTKPKKKAASRDKEPTLDELTEMYMNGDVRVDEDGYWEQIDPNEMRYCLCGDVSYGTMICCEASGVSSLFPRLFFFLSSFYCNKKVKEN
jgi:hypothetical protein